MKQRDRACLYHRRKHLLTPARSQPDRQSCPCATHTFVPAADDTAFPAAHATAGPWGALQPEPESFFATQFTRFVVPGGDDDGTAPSSWRHLRSHDAALAGDAKRLLR